MSMTKEAVVEKMKELNVVVLDVLPENEFMKLHIKGSVSLPMGFNAGDFVEAVEKRYGRDKFFITYCGSSSGNSAPDAAKALQKKSFNANDYAGGLREWSEAGFPTEGSEWMEKADVATRLSK